MKAYKKIFYLLILLLLFNCESDNSEENTYLMFGKWDIYGEKLYVKWNEYDLKYDSIKVNEEVLYDVITIFKVGRIDYSKKIYPEANVELSSSHGKDAAPYSINLFSNELIRNKKISSMSIDKSYFIFDVFDISNLRINLIEYFDYNISFNVFDSYKAENDSIEISLTAINDSILIYKFTGNRIY